MASCRRQPDDAHHDPRPCDLAASTCRKTSACPASNPRAGCGSLRRERAHPAGWSSFQRAAPADPRSCDRRGCRCARCDGPRCPLRWRWRRRCFQAVHHGRDPLRCGNVCVGWLPSIRGCAFCSGSAFCVSSSGVDPCTMLASAAAISMAGILPSVSTCSSSGWNSLPAPDSTAAVIFSLNFTSAQLVDVGHARHLHFFELLARDALDDAQHVPFARR